MKKLSRFNKKNLYFYSFLYSYIITLIISIFYDYLKYTYINFYLGDSEFIALEVSDIISFDIGMIFFPLILFISPIIAMFYKPIFFLYIIFYIFINYMVLKKKNISNHRNVIYITLLFVIWNMFGLYSLDNILPLAVL